MSRKCSVISVDNPMDLQQTDCPGALLHLDVLAKLAIQNGILALESYRELLLEDLDGEVSRTGPLGNRDHDVNFTKLLLPSVGES